MIVFVHFLLVFIERIVHPSFLELLTEVYSEDCMSRARMFEWHKRFSEAAWKMIAQAVHTQLLPMTTLKICGLWFERTEGWRSSSSWGSKFGQGKCSTNSKGRIEREKGLCKNGSKTAVRWTKRTSQGIVFGPFATHWEWTKFVEFDNYLWWNLGIYVDPETKWLSMQWKSTKSPRPKKSTYESFEVQGHVDCFFDIQGIVMAEWVPSSQTVNQQYCIEVLMKLREHVRRKRPELCRNGWILHQDNAPAHKALSVKQFLANKNITVHEHPPYLLHLAPCNFYLFPKITSVVEGAHFGQVENVKAKTAEILDSLTEHDLRNCFEHWQHRMQLCVNSEADCFEGDRSWFHEFVKQSFRHSLLFLCRTS